MRGAILLLFAVLAGCATAPPKKYDPCPDIILGALLSRDTPDKQDRVDRILDFCSKQPK